MVGASVSMAKQLALRCNKDPEWAALLQLKKGEKKKKAKKESNFGVSGQTKQRWSILCALIRRALLDPGMEAFKKPVRMQSKKGITYGLPLRTGYKSRGQSCTTTKKPASSGKNMAFHIIITDSRLGKPGQEKVALHNLLNSCRVRAFMAFYQKRSSARVLSFIACTAYELDEYKTLFVLNYSKKKATVNQFWSMLNVHASEQVCNYIPSEKVSGTAFGECFRSYSGQFSFTCMMESVASHFYLQRVLDLSLQRLDRRSSHGASSNETTKKALEMREDFRRNGDYVRKSAPGPKARGLEISKGHRSLCCALLDGQEFDTVIQPAGEENLLNLIYTPSTKKTEPPCFRTAGGPSMFDDRLFELWCDGAFNTGRCNSTNKSDDDEDDEEEEEEMEEEEEEMEEEEEEMEEEEEEMEEEEEEMEEDNEAEEDSLGIREGDEEADPSPQVQEPTDDQQDDQQETGTEAMTETMAEELQQRERQREALQELLEESTCNEWFDNFACFSGL
jgi:hypothetical protein